MLLNNKYNFSNRNPSSDFSFINPGTGALVGGLVGAAKGGIEQDPYQEVSPGDRALKVLVNGAIGAGAGASIGAVPRLLSHNPNTTAGKVATVLQNDTKVPLLTMNPKRARVNGKLVDLEVDFRQLEERQRILDAERKARLLRRDVRRTNARQNQTALTEGFNRTVVEPALVAGDAISGAVQGTVNAGKGFSNALYNVTDPLIDWQSTKNAAGAIKLPFSASSSYMADFNLNAAIAIGGVAGGGAGLLYGASKGLTDNKEQGDRRLLNVQTIQDPYLRIRQQEIYDSTPSKVGRAVGDTTNLVGNTALGTGVGAGLGAAAIGGAVLGGKLLGNPGLYRQPKPNRFIKAINTVVKG